MGRDERTADTAPHAVGHVHLKVRELPRAVGFYTDVLGLAVVEEYGQYAFLSFGERHHDVALQAVGDGASPPGPGVGLYHAAFEVSEAEELAYVYDRLTQRDHDVVCVDHGISEALYFDDPDGNGLEVYRDTRDENDQQQWQGDNERFDPHERE